MSSRVNRRMKVERARLGVTQAEVAGAIKVSPEAYASYENGRVDVPLSKAIEIAKYFGVTLDYLFREGADLRNSKV